MSRVWEFIKTTFVGGIVLIVPLAVLIIAINHLLDLLVSLNTWLAQQLPYENFGNPHVVLAQAIIMLVLACFLTGLLLRAGFLQRLADKINEFLERKIPLYGMVRTMTKRIAGADALQFTPAEVDLYGTGARSLAFVIEELPDDRYAVFVPNAPTLTTGSVAVVPKSSLAILDKPPKLVADAITQWGAGTRELYATDTSSDKPSG